MEVVYGWMGQIQTGVFILGALLIPLWLKRFKWLAFVAIGHIAYIIWGLYSGELLSPGNSGTGYGTMIFPYLAVISLIGYLLQKFFDRAGPGEGNEWKGDGRE